MLRSFSFSKRFMRNMLISIDPMLTTISRRPSPAPNPAAKSKESPQLLILSDFDVETVTQLELIRSNGVFLCMCALTQHWYAVPGSNPLTWALAVLVRWPWRSRVIPVWLLLPPCVVMPVPVLPPPSLQFCIGRHASYCPPSRQFLSSHLRHSSRCVRISIIPVLLSPHSSDLPSSVGTPVAVLHHSSEGLSST